MFGRVVALVAFRDVSPWEACRTAAIENGTAEAALEAAQHRLLRKWKAEVARWRPLSAWNLERYEERLTAFQIAFPVHCDPVTGRLTPTESEAAFSLFEALLNTGGWRHLLKV